MKSTGINEFKKQLSSFWTLSTILFSLFGPVIGTSSIDYAQLSRLLPEDGDQIQSPKRCVLNNKIKDDG
jgi:hypothetical protein